MLALVAQGLRSKEIARRLAAIFAKLDVTTRAQAVSAAHRLGVVHD